MQLLLLALIALLAGNGEKGDTYAANSPSLEDILGAMGGGGENIMTEEQLDREIEKTIAHIAGIANDDILRALPKLLGLAA